MVDENLKAAKQKAPFLAQIPVDENADSWCGRQLKRKGSDSSMVDENLPQPSARRMLVQIPMVDEND